MERSRQDWEGRGVWPQSLKEMRPGSCLGEDAEGEPAEGPNSNSFIFPGTSFIHAQPLSRPS